MCLLFFYSTFSLSSHIFNSCSLSFFFKLDSLTLTDPSQIKQLPSPLVWRLHRRHWSIARQSEAASSSITLTTDGWLSLVIDWSIGLGFCWRFWVFFFFFFGWGFWIWNLFKDPVIVVVVCGGGCWFLGGGDCH